MGACPPFASTRTGRENCKRRRKICIFLDGVGDGMDLGRILNSNRE
jgi:hypothetical protein